MKSIKSLTIASAAWLTSAIFIISLALQPPPVEAGAGRDERAAIRISWNFFHYGELPAGQFPSSWQPFSSIDKATGVNAAGSQLWLKGKLPPGNGDSGELFVTYFMEKEFDISLFVNEREVFASDKVLPAGFISWRMVSYEPQAQDGEPVVLARLTPYPNLDKGFELWAGPSEALAKKAYSKEALAWAGALVLALLCVASITLFAFNRRQPLFIYFFLLFASLAIDLVVLWGGWQFAVRPEQLEVLGAWIHFNWYLGYVSGIMVTYSIVGNDRSKWIRHLSLGVLLYAVAAHAGWLLFGEKVQLLFYELFYDYISTGLLLSLAIALILALKRRRDLEIKLFAVGNGLIVGGLVLGRLASGQLLFTPSMGSLITSNHTLVNIGWNIVGFIGMVCCLGMIMGLRLIRMAQLRSYNSELKRLNADLKNANDKLSRIDEIRSNMYSEVSHELNTPITAIKGYVQLMLKGKIPAGEPQYLQVIYDKSLVMERMIDDMMEIAKLENKHIQFDFEPLRLSAFLDRLFAKAQPGMLAEGYRFQWFPLVETQSPELAAVVHADAMRLEQVVQNLLSNARKFTPAGGRIEVDAEILLEDGTHYAMIRFADNGRGIPSEEQSRIFDRYYRGRAAKEGSIAGSGLGLPICQEIMSAHGGEIGLESSSEGRSVFYMKLPVRLMPPERL